MWGIELKGFRRQAYLSSSQGQEGGKEDNVKYDKDNMNDKGNYYDSIFFKTISCHTISEPQAQAEVNDDGKYDKGHKNINDDNKMFFSKYQVSYIFETTSSIGSEWWQRQWCQQNIFVSIQMRRKSFEDLWWQPKTHISPIWSW